MAVVCPTSVWNTRYLYIALTTQKYCNNCSVNINPSATCNCIKGGHILEICRYIVKKSIFTVIHIELTFSKKRLVIERTGAWNILTF